MKFFCLKVLYFIFYGRTRLQDVDSIVLFYHLSLLNGNSAYKKTAQVYKKGFCERVYTILERLL